ncbi:nuclear transport factor 2 family protein [Agromyces sp. SYSU T00194]|uniref:nuclear transport factor 2 family protein n=1 Tax=Agromyces chitinivorans TaxID=3158560 RepID=UPI003395431B
MTDETTAFDDVAADATLDRYIAAAEARDGTAAGECLADDAVFRSATTTAFEYVGRDDIAEMESATLAEFGEVRCIARSGSGDTRLVVFAFTLAGVEGQDAKLLRFAPDGRISEVTAFVRPLPALAQIPARVAPSIARRSGRRGLARMLALSSRPVAAMLRSGDASMSPKLDPARQR